MISISSLQKTGYKHSKLCCIQSATGMIASRVVAPAAMVVLVIVNIGHDFSLRRGKSKTSRLSQRFYADRRIGLRLRKVCGVPKWALER